MQSGVLVPVGVERAPGGVADSLTGREGTDCDAVLDVSVLVPTRNEQVTVGPLIDRLTTVLHALQVRYEIVVVDDSDDATLDLLLGMARSEASLRVLHRDKAERVEGLGGALLHGFQAARGRVSVVMDGDLQHPPELLPRLILPLVASDADLDLVIATRYSAGGSADGFSGPVRRLLSRIARVVVHILVPSTRGLSDPCGGFFAFRTALLSDIVLRPQGFKILVEVLARTRWRRAAEVAYAFAGRSGGESTFGWRECRRFLLHLARLVLLPTARPPRRSGLAPHLPLVELVEQQARGFQLRPAQRLRTATTASKVALACLVLFLLLETAFALTLSNGPFLDEGIYITAGTRTLQGHGISDGYLAWFAGSLLWPSLAGAAFKIGGLAGARLLAALFVTVGVGCGARATRNLFGSRAAAWGTAAVLCSAPALELGHLAVYDVVAVAGLGGTLLALTELDRTGHRRWVVAAAAAFAVGVLGKYPLVFLLPVVLLVAVVLRGRRAAQELSLMAPVFVGLMLVFFLPWRYQLAYFVHWRVGNDPSFGVTRGMIAYEQLLYGLPFLIIALIGVAVVPRSRRPVAIALASALLVFPLYHLAVGNSVSATKHILFGILLAMPVVGVGLDWLSGRRWWRRAAALGLTALFFWVGLGQTHRLDHGWVDAAPGGAYLAAHMHPGQTVLVPNAWQVLPYLYGHGVADLHKVTDAYGYAHASPPINLCHTDWLVDTVNDNAWSSTVMARMHACGTFREVFTSRSRLTNLDRHLHYFTYNGSFVVYSNTGSAG